MTKVPTWTGFRYLDNLREFRIIHIVDRQGAPLTLAVNALMPSYGWETCGRWLVVFSPLLFSIFFLYYGSYGSVTRETGSLFGLWGSCVCRDFSSLHSQFWTACSPQAVLLVVKGLYVKSTFSGVGCRCLGKCVRGSLAIVDPPRAGGWAGMGILGVFSGDRGAGVFDQRGSPRTVNLDKTRR